MLGLYYEDPSIFIYSLSGCGKSYMAKNIYSQMGLDIVIVKGLSTPENMRDNCLKDSHGRFS